MNYFIDAHSPFTHPKANPMKFILTLLLPLFLLAQESQKIEYVEFIQTIDSKGNIQSIEVSRTKLHRPTD
jgi:hypothetical protein